MDTASRAEAFLRLYRTLEGILEKRYAGRRAGSGSVVMEYLKDPDSAPCRADLDLCRSVRNLLSHSVGEAGEPVIEPSREVLALLEAIVEYAKHPRMAVDYGTPADHILFAHPNDCALDVLRHMLRMGYSHVPVRDKTGLIGVLSTSSLMVYAAGAGLDGLRDDMRVGDLRGAIGFSDGRSEKYLFMPPDTTLMAARKAFEKRRERNSRLAAIFITEDGERGSRLLAMLTPWDALNDAR